MTKEKNIGHPEGGIYEPFAYTPKLSAYPNISDMNELYDICHSVYKPALRLRGGERDGNKKGI